MSLLFTIIVFLLMLSFLVVIHELGHFLSALWMKVKIEEFGLGYPPKALTLFHWRGIPFTLNWLPFGGFVKMEGEDGPDTQETRTSYQEAAKKEIGPFYSKSKRSRLLVLLAGVTINFLFGIIAFSFVYTQIGIPRLSTDQQIIENAGQYRAVDVGGKVYDVSSADQARDILQKFNAQVRVIGVGVDSPAEQAGVPLGWNILQVTAGEESVAVTQSNQVIEFVNHHQGSDLTLIMQGPCDGVECEEQVQDFTVYARTNEEIPEGQASLGVSFDQSVLVFYSSIVQQVWHGTVTGIEQSIGLSVLILQAFGGMIQKIFTTAQVPAGVAGPVGIVHQASKLGIFQQGLLSIVNFAGMLSINLAILNLLPIPAFDGGRAVLVLSETVIGRKRREQIENKLNYLGLFFLIGLMLLITANDVLNIVKEILS